MKIAVSQINPTLGDFSYNSELIFNSIKKAAKNNVDVIVFPECSLFGYHPFDLLERSSIVNQQNTKLNQLHKKMPKGIAALLGAIVKNPKKNGKPYLNAAVFLQKDKKIKVFAKELLPTFDVFDEARHIEIGDVSKNILKFKGKTILVTICEDIWAWPEPGRTTSIHRYNPLKKLTGEKFDLIFNLSASPFFIGKMHLRKSMIKKTAKYFKAPLIYANLYGAQDEIIYDGQSLVVDQSGHVIQKAKQFEADYLEFKLEDNKLLPLQKVSHKTINATEELYQAIVLGIRDFVTKVGFKKVHLGLSGGIDSAVVAALAAQAIGPENLTVIGLPGPFNSIKSLQSAIQLCKNLGANWYEASINSAYNSIVETVESSFGQQEFGLVHENIQARIRSILLMAFSNKNNSLLLNTSNKSELAMGYSTLYGDLSGGLSPIGDLLKREIFQLAKYINKDKEVIPKFIITRPPSAELRPDQKDEDSLPEYKLLDQSVEKIVTFCKTPTTKVDKQVLNALIKRNSKDGKPHLF